MIPPETNVRSAIHDLGTAGAFRKLIAGNAVLIRSDDLDIGRKIVTERSAIYTELVCHWAEGQHRRLGYDKPFAVVALGGTGRGEMTPYSDTDFAFLFDEPLEGNSFLLELQKQVLHGDYFETNYGFRCEALPFSLDDVPNLTGKQLNSFLDIRPVYDPAGLTQIFLERIRASYNPFDHFLHVREFWREQWESASLRSEDFDHFDIKNEGLRVFLAGIWTLAGKDFRHSLEIYDSLEEPRDLEAYEFLLRIRTFVHSRRTGKRKPGGGGNHPEDIMTFEDFTSFGEMLGPDASLRERFEFGNIVRARLFAARRRIALFTRTVIRQELKKGRVVARRNPIVYGLGGLFLKTQIRDKNPRERSRLALSLLIASQRYSTPIDHVELQNAFWNAGEWLQIVPELSALFYEEKGCLADTFEFLSLVEGAEDRLFPGYAIFESSLDGRTMVERNSLRGKLQRQKIRALDGFLTTGKSLMESAISPRQMLDLKSELNVNIEAALLDSDHVAAIKLALKTKRLPLTQDDIEIRRDESYPLHERYASGLSEIPLEDYYQPYFLDGGFSEHTIEIVKFLIAHRGAFMDYTLYGMNDFQQVEEFVQLCGDENRLRALFVFTCADRIEWESEHVQPDRWFNIRELCSKAMTNFRPPQDPSRALAAAGYTPDELAILKDFGQDFFEGMYRRYANRFGAHLLRLALEPEFDKSKTLVLRDGASIILGIAARDFRGLAATITGVLWQQKIGLRQAHLFSSFQHGLALDFFHLKTNGEPLPDDLASVLEDAINSRCLIDEGMIGQLPPIDGSLTFSEWRPHQYCLRFEGKEDGDGLVYTLTYKMYQYLKADIFGLIAYSTRKGVFVSVYHNLPPEVTPEDAKLLTETYF